jgi:hypothetical protein
MSARRVRRQAGAAPADRPARLTPRSQPNLDRSPSRLRGTTPAMTLSRLTLVYGEVTTVAEAELTWRELLPARLRVPRPQLAPAGPRAELIRQAPS